MFIFKTHIVYYIPKIRQEADLKKNEVVGDIEVSKSEDPPEITLEVTSHQPNQMQP